MHRRFYTTLTLVAMALGACDEPTPISPAIPEARNWAIVSGLITERVLGAVLRSEGAYVALYVQPGGERADYVSQGRADREGRYTFVSVPKGSMVQLGVDPAGDDLVHQCAAPPTVVSGDTVINREVVARDLAAISPSSIAPTEGFRTISGIVRRGADRTPGANMYVAYDVGWEFTAAFTSTDRNGRYLLCGIPRDRKASISVWCGFDNAEWIEVPAGESTDTVDFALPF